MHNNKEIIKHFSHAESAYHQSQSLSSRLELLLCIGLTELLLKYTSFKLPARSECCLLLALLERMHMFVHLFLHKDENTVFPRGLLMLL